MKGQAVVFSKGKDDWRTPRALFEALDAEFHFTTDAAADVHNTLVSRHWFGPGSPDGMDALVVPWGAMNWCNPPYSMVKKFVQKASQEMLRGNKTVMLIPARTDTRWFHEFIYQHLYNRVRMGVTVRFLKGRVKFIDPAKEQLEDGSTLLRGAKMNGSNNSAPFPSMIVVFGW